MNKKAFTLIELLLVIAIMGLMGTAAVGGYRAMQRGMEERGVMQNASQFIRSAYQRAQVDRTPVAIYFWNETIREETQDESIVVVGKAVAVRQMGRISYIDGSYLCDEFGDLKFRCANDDDSEMGSAGSPNNAAGIALYRMKGNEVTRTLVTPETELRDVEIRLVSSEEIRPIELYGFKIVDGGVGNWRKGDAYGMEFSEIQLPHNFIFTSDYNSNLSNPVKELTSKTMIFRPGQESSEVINICNLRVGSSGDLEAKSIGDTENPTKKKD